MTDFSIIGKRIAMVDAAGKTTGAGKYTDDLCVPGMLVGRILHSPYPHARIRSIDTSRAEKLEGVAAVAIGSDAPNTALTAEQSLANMRDYKLSRPAQTAVLGDNARRLLGAVLVDK